MLSSVFVAQAVFSHCLFDAVLSCKRGGPNWFPCGGGGPKIWSYATAQSGI